MLIGPSILLAAESASSGGIGAIGLDWRQLLFQLINFALLFWLLKKVAYKPIVKVLEDRRTRIESSLAKAEEIEQNQAKIAEQQARALKEARTSAAEIVAKTRVEAAELLKQAEITTQAQSTKLIEEAHNKINQELIQAKQGLKLEMTQLVVAATEVILQEKVDVVRDEALIERSLKQAEEAR